MKLCLLVIVFLLLQLFKHSEAARLGRKKGSTITKVTKETTDGEDIVDTPGVLSNKEMTAVLDLLKRVPPEVPASVNTFVSHL